MYLRSRHRRGNYALAQESALPGWVRLLLLCGAILLAAYLLWTATLRILGIDNAFVRAGASLMVEERGTVTVTIDGQQQRAENGMMLFSGEQAATGPGAHASLQFFDGTKARLDDGTAATIVESERGESESHVVLELDSGKLWLSVPPSSAFSGTILRRIFSPTLRFDIPAGTEAVVSPTSIAVFSGDGDGVAVTHAQGGTFTISEGQQWSLPADGKMAGDAYAYRSPLDPLAVQAVFVTDSRRLLSAKPGTKTPAGGGAAAGSDLLTVTAPQNGLVVQEAVLTVQGSAGASVAHVMINGYPAILDAKTGAFAQQVAPPEGQGDFELKIQALDAARNVLAEVRRSVKRGPAPELRAPTVTVPAKTGETYRTLKEELILRGGAPVGAAGILVNDYKLQLFDPAKGEWSYVASLRLNNMKPGTNVYDVVAVDASGRKSPAARLTIIQGEGPEGVVSATSSSNVSSGPLPSNAPLLPGTLSVTAPSAGLSHSETGTGFLLEGLTSAQTATVSVNDYTLQLYKAGKTTWNYIVDVNFNNLKSGKNVYAVVARNAKGEILDRIEYVVEYTPSSR